MSDTTTTARELDWYLRDHFFRQSNAGKTSFRTESLPNEMATLYLRYRNADLHQLGQDSNELKLLGKLTRLQCAKCFYINYLTDAELRTCMRCQHADLHDFPPKKKA
jgi:hypothetical protein